MTRAASTCRARRLDEHRQLGQAIDSTAVIDGRAPSATRTAGGSPPFWTNIQAKSTAIQGRRKVFPAGLQASSAHIDVIATAQWRDRHEDRRHRRHRPHRNEARRAGCARRAMRSWRRRPTRASTPSPARAWPKRWQARRSSSTWRTRRRSRTRPCWSSSRRRAATCSPRKRPPACRHHVALSVVGTDRLPDSGYLRAKMAQENLIKASGIPYTILRSTQFFEFVERHRAVRHRRADGSPVAGPAAADRVRRRGRRHGRRHARRAGQRHDRDRRTRDKVPLDELVRRFLPRQAGPAQCHRRRPRALLRRRA